MKRLWRNHARIGKILRGSLIQFSALILFVSISFAGARNAQDQLNTNITIKLQKVSFGKALQEIKEKTG